MPQQEQQRASIVPGAPGDLHGGSSSRGVASDRPGGTEEHDDAYWADFGKTFGQGFLAGMQFAQQMAQHQATQEAAAERRIGNDRPGVQVIVGNVSAVDDELHEMRVVTNNNVNVWAFYGDTISTNSATQLAEGKKRVRITVPTGKQGSHQAYYSGEMVDPDTT